MKVVVKKKDNSIPVAITTEFIKLQDAMKYANIVYSGGEAKQLILDTSIHVNDGDFALQDGLIPELVYSDVYSKTLHPCKDDFITFGTRIGVLPKKLNAIIELFATEQPKVYELIENSFLEEKVKRMYKQSYQERLHRFQRSDE